MRWQFLITGILCILGVAWFLFFVIQVIATTETYLVNWSDGDITFEELVLNLAVMSTQKVQGVNISLFLAEFLFITALIMWYSLRSPWIAVGNTFMILAILGNVLIWSTKAIFQTPHMIINGIYLLGSLCCMIGLFRYHKHFKLVFLLTPLFIILTFIVFIILPIVIMSQINNPYSSFLALEKDENLYLLLFCIYLSYMGIFTLLLSFSRKRIETAADSELSVEDQSAFASYVPKKPIKAKPTKTKEIEFKF